MRNVILAVLGLLSVNAFANTPQMSNEVAVCKGEFGGSEKEITIFRDINDKSKATILFKELSTPVVAFQNILFTEAVASRVGNTIEVKHQKINISVDLASEKSDKSVSGQWDNQVSLTCKIITPVID